MQNLTVQKIVLAGVFLAGCAAAVFCASQVAEGNYRILIFLFAAVAGVTILLSARENFWMAIPIGLSLSLPAVPIGFRQLEAAELAVILASLLFVIRIALQNQPIRLHPQWSWPILLYLGMVALSYARRPVGLWVLGSESGGARFYLKIGMALMAFLILASVEIREKQVKWVLLAALVGNIFTAAWNAYCTYYMPAFAWLRTTAVFQEEEQFYTWHQTLSFAALPVYAFILALLPFKKLFSLRHCFWSIPVLGFCCLLVALSGKRAGLAMCMVFPVVIGLARKEYFYLGIISVVGSVMIAILVVGQGLAFNLPLTVQRTLVNLPGKWDERVVKQTKGDSFNTEPDQFRKDMRERAWRVIRENPWTGQGLGVDLKQMMALIISPESIGEKEREGHAAAGNWHSKWLGMAADLGIPAAVFYAVFNFMLLGLYVHLAKSTQGMGWINIFVLVQLCFVVRGLLTSTVGGHTALNPFEEWWVYGMGLSIYYRSRKKPSSVPVPGHIVEESSPETAKMVLARTTDFPRP